MILYLAISQRDLLDSLITRLLVFSVLAVVSVIAICADATAGNQSAANRQVRYAGSNASFTHPYPATVELHSEEPEIHEIWLWAASH